MVEEEAVAVGEERGVGLGGAAGGGGQGEDGEDGEDGGAQHHAHGRNGAGGGGGWRWLVVLLHCHSGCFRIGGF